MNRQELANALNNSGLSQKMSQLRMALVDKVTKAVQGEEEPLTGTQYDRFILNSIGPAAASSVIENSIILMKEKGGLNGLSLNGSMTHNADLIFNSVDDCSGFSSTLRQFLLPRYAYLDFDSIIDPRHHIDRECGYPKFITPIMYRYMYDRDDMARRVVDIYPDESWASDPDVFETDNEDEETPFEEDWKKICEDHDILQLLYQMDKQAGVGHYGSLLIGVADDMGSNLEVPINESDLLAGKLRSVSKKKRELLYVRPFDEYLSFIHRFETNENNPRFGMPVDYSLVFLDMTIDAAGAGVGSRLNRHVNWTRIVHVADNLQSGRTFGTPRQQPVFNRLLDLRKIKGGSAEMFWKGAFPGLSFEVDPRLVEDQPEFDSNQFKEMIERYSNGLQRYLDTVGIKVTSLAPQVADPSKHVHIQMQAIAAHYGVPLRIFLGSEEGRLASSQDKVTWNQRLARRNKRFTEPRLIRAFIDRMIAIGVMRPPKNGRYFIEWGDLNAITDEDKANLALKWTQALSQYVASGCIHFMQPLDYMTIILGLKPRDALRIDKIIKSQGGYEKLSKVDPSQTNAGTNGVAQNNVSRGDRSGSSRSRPRKRNKADKRTEGSSS